MIQQQKVKTAINTLTQKQVTFSLRIMAHGKKKVTSRDLRVIKVQKVHKALKVRMEHKVYQDRDGRDGAAGRDGRDGRDGKDVLNGKS